MCLLHFSYGGCIQLHGICGMHVHACGAAGRQQSIRELLCVQIFQSIHVRVSLEWYH